MQDIEKIYLLLKVKERAMKNALQNSVLAIVISIIASLTACSKYHPTAKDIVSSVAPKNNIDAQTYALPREKDYSEDDHQDYLQGRVINPLIAPTNQTYYFNFDSTTLMSGDLEAIQVQAKYLSTHSSAKVRLEGNTDNRGSREYNIGLGWWRDRAVARLLKKEGVAPKQIDMVSYGKERPVIVGNNENAWSLNRRVNLIYETY